jgi:hypothetical protein
MALTIDQYRQYINSRKFVQNPSHYKVEISPGKGKDNQSVPLTVLYPDSVLLPGRNFINTPFGYYGPEFPIPLRREYNELSMNFIVYQDWHERKYFEEWMDSILPYSPDTSTLASDVLPSNFEDRLRNIEISFSNRPSDKSPIQSSNSINYGFNLYYCYPILITPTSFSSDNSGYTIFTINMAFKYYKALGGASTIQQVSL